MNHMDHSRRKITQYRFEHLNEEKMSTFGRKCSIKETVHHFNLLCYLKSHEFCQLSAMPGSHLHLSRDRESKQTSLSLSLRVNINTALILKCFHEISLAVHELEMNAVIG